VFFGDAEVSIPAVALVGLLLWRGAPQRLTKLAYAERLVAALALLFLRQRDAVGLVRFDDMIRTIVAPRARTTQWRRIIAALLDDPGAGRASNAAEGLLQAARLVRRPGMIILISDLLTDLEPVDRAIRALSVAGHDVTVLHVMDPAEREIEEPPPTP